MLRVDLCTEVQDAFEPDGMRVSLTIRMEGLSMQASLRKLQESADQMLTAFAAAGIDPASFEVRTLSSVSSDDGSRQSAILTLICRMEAQSERLVQIWQTVSGMPFTVEMDVSFYMQDGQFFRAALQERVLEEARKQAERLCELSGLSRATLESLDFEWNESDEVSALTLQPCQPPALAEGVTLHALPSLLSPQRTLYVRAKTGWRFTE